MSLQSTVLYPKGVNTYPQIGEASHRPPSTSGLPHPLQLCQPAVVKRVVVVMSADLVLKGLHGGGHILRHPAHVISSLVFCLSLLFRALPALPAASWGMDPGNGLHASYLVVGRSFHTPLHQASQWPGWLAAPISSPPFLPRPSPLSLFCFSAVPSVWRLPPVPPSGRDALPPRSLFSCPSPTFSLDLVLSITYSGTFFL